MALLASQRITVPLMQMTLNEECVPANTPLNLGWSVNEAETLRCPLSKECSKGCSPADCQ